MRHDQRGVEFGITLYGVWYGEVWILKAGRIWKDFETCITFISHSILLVCFKDGFSVLFLNESTMNSGR